MPLCFFCGAILSCSTFPASLPASRQSEHTLEFPGGTRLSYLLYRPVEYGNGTGLWPLILFLHGDGERGGDLSEVKREGLPRILEGPLHFPFLVLSPHLARRQSWSTEELDVLLAKVSSRERVDRSRVFGTGLSGGGNAVLELAAAFPERFAAVAVASINRLPKEACRLRMPLWIFHNSGDERIPVHTARKLVGRLRECGVDVRLTVYPREGHDAWSETYARSDLYEWFQNQASGSFP